MKMSRILKVMGIGVILFLTFIVVLGVLLTILYEIQEEETKEGVIQEEGTKKEETKKETTLRVVNGTFSFCFISNGKKYYFEVLGWIKPNSTILRRYLSLFEYGVSWKGGYSSYGKGLILFLAVRTNLDWEWYMSVAECRVGELYKECFLGCIDYALRIDNDTLLIPYVLEVCDFWESYKIVSKHYEKMTEGRLYFEVYNFLGLKKDDVVKIGRIVLTCNPHHRDEIDMYINHPLPRFSIVIENITYLGYDGEWYLFNVTLRLKDIGMIVEYSFDEFGRKKSLSEEFIPLYLLTAERYPEELWTVEKINKTHYLITVPTASGHGFANRYHFGGGFEDVWKEPQHEYIGSYASPSRNIWLKIDRKSVV